MSSNIMSFLCKGDVAYSVGMTCAISCAWHSISSTILANIFAHQQTSGVQKKVYYSII